MNIILFGPPGSGKGTQSGLLVDRLGLKQISTGDLFRAAMKNGTVLGKQAQTYVDSGQLVPDSITIGLVDEILRDLRGASFVLDGFPRTVPQAEALEAQLKKYGLQIDGAYFLEVPMPILINRLSGRRVCKNCGTTYHIESKPSRISDVCDVCGGVVAQRKDDAPEAISTRLEAYQKATSPLREYFRSKGVGRDIDGVGSMDEIFARLQKSMEKGGLKKTQ